VVRSAAGAVTAVVEEAQATPEQLMLNELNVGAYCFSGDWLWDALKKIKVSPKGEYYLTDIVSVASEAGLNVQAIALADEEEAIGINTRKHLAEAEAVLRRRINERWMLAGVTMLDPNWYTLKMGWSLGRIPSCCPIPTCAAARKLVKAAGLVPTRSSKIRVWETVVRCFHQ